MKYLFNHNLLWGKENVNIKKRRRIFLFFLMFTLTHIINAQEISSQLDSIHNLQNKDIHKLELFDKLFEHHTLLKDFWQLGHDAHQLAKWIYKDDLDKAIYYTRLAVDARQKSINPFDPCLLKMSYYNLGFFNKRKGNLAEAIISYKQVIAINESLSLNGKAFTNLGKLYYSIGDDYMAAKYYEKSFYFLDSNNPQSFINNHIKIARAYRKIRTTESSLKVILHLQKADSLIRNIKNPNPQDIYDIYNNIGVQYYQNIPSEIDKAIFYYKKALDQASIMQNEKYLRLVHHNLGLAYMEIDHKNAEALFLKSLDFQKDKNYLKKSIFLGLGSNDYKNKKFKSAQSYYKQSLSYFFNKNINQDNWSPSKKELGNINNKPLLLQLFKRQIKNWIAIGNLEAYQHAINAVKIGDRLVTIMLLEDLSVPSKLLWRDLASEIYILGLEACFKTNNQEDAFYLMEKIKALLLTQEIANKKISLPENILELEMNIKDKISDFQIKHRNISVDKKDSISELLIKQKIKLERFQDSLSKKYSEYFSNSSLPKIVPFSEVNLEDDHTIIQYAMAARVAGVTPNAYGMLITNDTTKLFKIEEVEILLKNIEKLRKKLDQPFTTSEDITSYKMIASELYNQLIPNTIQSELKNKKVTIIADHMISFIPFEALVTANGNYLIQNCEINYIYSLSFQKENQSLSRNTELDFLGVAPVSFSKDLTSLKNSSKEITNANRFYDGDLLLNKEATKENFIKEIKNYKILHLATHADASDSIAPWIAFRNSKLTELELNSLQNQAELVVLSACNTSLGEVMRGEGVMSLARGFFKSGASTVIPSLWSTNDKATATITSDFYKNLSEGQTKSAALRSAKLNYLNINTDAEASPHYWASLVLIGDSGTLLPATNYWMFLWIGLGVIAIVLIVSRILIYRNNIS